MNVVPSETQTRTYPVSDERTRPVRHNSRGTGASFCSDRCVYAYRRFAAECCSHAVKTFDGHGVFFNDEHTATVAAFAERLMPGAPSKPGARDANVMNYIDLVLAGAYADQQDFYRRGLAWPLRPPATPRPPRSGRWSGPIASMITASLRATATQAP
jgi:Gluconate 2-dehydrogenase subunit 3